MMSACKAKSVEKERDGRNLPDPRAEDDGEAEARGGSIIAGAVAPPLDEEALEPRPGLR